MTFEEPLVAAVQEAATPSEADVLVARGVILAAFAETDASVVTTEFEDRWLTAIGSQRPAGNSRLTALPATETGRRLADPDAHGPHLATFRARHAVRRALAQHSPLIDISGGSYSRFMPVRPTDSGYSEVLLPVEELLPASTSSLVPEG